MRHFSSVASSPKSVAALRAIHDLRVVRCGDIGMFVGNIDHMRRFSFLAVLLFAAASVLSALHAAEHGLDPHDHDGVLCAVQLVEDEQDHTLPPPPQSEFFVPQRQPKTQRSPQDDDLAREAFAIRPPPTGPPVLIEPYRFKTTLVS